MIAKLIGSLIGSILGLFIRCSVGFLAYDGILVAHYGCPDIQFWHFMGIAVGITFILGAASK